MLENEHLNVNIEKFSNLGYGIAKVDGRVIFVEGACPKDYAEIKITKVKKSYAYAKVTKVLTPSPHRITPFCSMQSACGACQLGFIDYEYQLELKRQVVQEEMTNNKININIPAPVPSPKIKEYRHKIQYPIAQTKVSKRLLAGYYKPSTHDIVNIKHCPIQPEICDRIIEYIRNNEFGITGYDEQKRTGDLRHVVIRVSSVTGKCLVVLVINSTKPFDKIKKLSNALFKSFEEISGVCLNYNTKNTNVILSDKSECVEGFDYIEEKILDKVFRIGANTFFQINPKSAENIFKYVKDYIKNNYEKPTVLDAYAGISAFGITVSDASKLVVSVEENNQSCELAKQSLTDNNISNVEINCMDAAKFFRQEKRIFDCVILDPPRKGCTKESLDAALKLCKGTIIYVSCNPSTLARDLKYLTEKGASVKSIQPFDMFCHTYHIENVAIISV